MKITEAVLSQEELDFAEYNMNTYYYVQDCIDILDKINSLLYKRAKYYEEDSNDNDELILLLSNFESAFETVKSRIGDN